MDCRMCEFIMLHPKKYPFSWRPGWSFSRMGVFGNCLRQYFFQYYGKRYFVGDERVLWSDLYGLSSVPLVMVVVN